MKPTKCLMCGLVLCVCLSAGHEPHSHSESFRLSTPNSAAIVVSSSSSTAGTLVQPGTGKLVFTTYPPTVLIARSTGT